MVMLNIAATVGIEESAPRLASRQQHRTNIHADNCIQYYQRNLTIPLLDHLIAELNNSLILSHLSMSLS